MAIDWGVVATIAAPIIAIFVGVAVERYFRNKPQLIAYLGHSADFDVQPADPITANPVKVFTHSIVISNLGNEPATNVRIGHKFDMPNIKIEPSIDYTERQGADGTFELIIPKMVAKEQITISYLYFYPWTVDQIHSYIKSDTGFAKVINVLPQQQYPKWVGQSIAVFAIIGVVAFFYMLYSII